VAHTAREDSALPRFAGLAACAAICLAMLFAGAAPASADTGQAGTPTAQTSSLKKHGGQGQKSKIRRQRRLRAHRAHARRMRRASRNASISSNSVVSRRRTKAAPSSAAANPFDADCDGSLVNWNTAGVGESIPTLAGDIVRSGSGSCRVALSGTQDRSELIFGGNGGASTAGMFEFREGDEYWYGFSFYIVSMTYGGPGAHNTIMQFKGDDDGSPAFALQLWDYEGDDGEYADNPKGLWSGGEAMGGDRFLAPAAERQWHDVAIHFKASAAGAGFYEVYLDGKLVDSRSGVSTLINGAGYAYIKNGLYRNGGEIPGNSEIRLDAARLGTSLSSVSPS
jgi:hypothetical protein